MIGARSRSPRWRRRPARARLVVDAAPRRLRRARRRGRGDGEARARPAPVARETADVGSARPRARRGAAEADPVRRPARPHHHLLRRLPVQPAAAARRGRASARRRLRLRALLLGARLLVDQRPRLRASRRRPGARRSTRSARATTSAGDGANPDTVAFLGWEWTQVGTTPENHYGHKNVVLAHTDDARIPARPIGALRGGELVGRQPSTARARLRGAARRRPHARPRALHARARERAGLRPGREPVRELPADCIEQAADARGAVPQARRVGPRRAGDPARHDLGLLHAARARAGTSSSPAPCTIPTRQTLLEIYSGHGDGEVYRDWQEVEFDAEGKPQSARRRVPTTSRPAGAPARSSARAAWRRARTQASARRARSSARANAARGGRRRAPHGAGRDGRRLPRRRPVSRLPHARLQLPAGRLRAVHARARQLRRPGRAAPLPLRLHRLVATTTTRVPAPATRSSRAAA